ncbi:MAG: biotin transporter BioY [Actinomycetaceae bacterium]|nr:biotin transporter BioY [Actinomycetaceae bacterium]
MSAVAAYPVFADAVVPSRVWSKMSERTRDIVLVLAGVLLVAAFAQIRIPLQPVAITGQTLGVVLVAGTLGAWRGVASLALYALIGAMGAPVFTGFEGGWQMVTGASFGYVLGFIPAAYVVGRLAQRGWDRSVKSIAQYGLGLAIPFMIGVPWLFFAMQAAGVEMSAQLALAYGLVPFIPGELAKLALAAAVMPVAWKVLNK